MTVKMAKSIFTPVNILIILGIANLMFLSGMFGYVQFSTQDKQHQDQLTQSQINATKDLVKAINLSDENDDNRTEYLLNRTIDYVIKNNIQLSNSTDALTKYVNQSVTLTKYLSDNFGSESGYAEREEFQYRQANITFQYLKDMRDLLKNEALKTEKNIIGNLTDHRHIANQTRDQLHEDAEEIKALLRNQSR